MLHFWGLQDTIEDLADASGTEFEIPAGFDDQVSVLTDLGGTKPSNWSC